MNKVYLCCPYSSEFSTIRILRFHAANKAAAKLMLAGNIVFSPISHSHPISICANNPNSRDFWLKQDFAFIEWADEIVILMLPGWEESKGIRLECKKALSLGKNIRRIEP